MGTVAALVAGRRSSPSEPDTRSGLSSQALRRHGLSDINGGRRRLRPRKRVPGLKRRWSVRWLGQRRAEAELHQDKLRFEGIVHSAMDAIITVDEAHKIVLFNQAAEKMFQWGAEEVLGRPLDRLLPERFRSAHNEHIREFGRSGITARQMGALGMVMGVRANGEEFPIEAAISQIGDGWDAVLHRHPPRYDRTETARTGIGGTRGPLTGDHRDRA
jgi:PAS domain S-box-containing protein